ncbi:hypothetical protein XHC_4399 [Xanthomonas hortorum pv. carotae str. M081]|nr:hypothetical protein XHC_4399 [Xanthomonas hortorum pv. carotae str. M081]
MAKLPSISKAPSTGFDTDPNLGYYQGRSTQSVIDRETA